MKQYLDKREFEDVQWLLPIALTIHNLEEAIWRPAWSRTAGVWHPAVGAGEFRFAIVVLTAGVYGITYASVTGGKESVGVYLLAGTASVLLGNVVVPHVAATLLLRRYAPGVVTAVALNLPLTLYLLRRAFREEYISRKRFGIAAGAAVVSAAAMLPILFAAGKPTMGAFKITWAASNAG